MPAEKRAQSCGRLEEKARSTDGVGEITVADAIAAYCRRLGIPAPAFMPDFQDPRGLLLAGSFREIALPIALASSPSADPPVCGSEADVGVPSGAGHVA